MSGKQPKPLDRRQESRYFYQDFPNIFQGTEKIYFLK